MWSSGKLVIYPHTNNKPKKQIVEHLKNSLTKTETPSCNHHIIKDERVVVVCVKCGLIIEDSPLIYEDHLYDASPWKHLFYEGTKYIAKKSKILCGLLNDLNESLSIHLYETVRDCTNWNEVRKKLKKNGQCEYINYIPALCNHPVYTSDMAFQYSCAILYKYHYKIKYEFLLLKFHAIQNHDYRYIPIYWSKPLLNKLEEKFEIVSKRFHIPNIKIKYNSKIDLKISIYH